MGISLSRGSRGGGKQGLLEAYPSRCEQDGWRFSDDLPDNGDSMAFG